MTAEARLGVVVLAAVVVATIAWLTFRPEPRHDGATRAQIEAIIRQERTEDGTAVRRARCGPAQGHWHCFVTLSDGRTIDPRTSEIDFSSGP
jgi:hypothetical protein